MPNRGFRGRGCARGARLWRPLQTWTNRSLGGGERASIPGQFFFRACIAATGARRLKLSVVTGLPPYSGAGGKWGGRVATLSPRHSEGTTGPAPAMEPAWRDGI